MTDIRRLEASDAGAYREIRLEGLELHPEAFGASFDTEAMAAPDFFIDRLQSNTVFGGFDSNALLGVAGYYIEKSPKECHKAMLFGMYVRKAARGRGLGQSLVRAVLNDARSRTESIRLTVEATNTAARHLYEQCGFTVYGTEPRSLQVKGRYYDELLMYLAFSDKS